VAACAVAAACSPPASPSMADEVADEPAEQAPSSTPAPSAPDDEAADESADTEDSAPVSLDVAPPSRDTRDRSVCSTVSDSDPEQTRERAATHPHLSWGGYVLSTRRWPHLPLGGVAVSARRPFRLSEYDEARRDLRLGEEDEPQMEGANNESDHDESPSSDTELDARSSEPEEEADPTGNTMNFRITPPAEENELESQSLEAAEKQVKALKFELAQSESRWRATLDFNFVYIGALEEQVELQKQQIKALLISDFIFRTCS
jgi:hypothetical protein